MGRIDLLLPKAYLGIAYVDVASCMVASSSNMRRNSSNIGVCHTGVCHTILHTVCPCIQYCVYGLGQLVSHVINVAVTSIYSHKHLQAQQCLETQQCHPQHSSYLTYIVVLRSHNRHVHIAGKIGPASTRDVLVKGKASHHVLWMTSGVMTCALRLCLPEKQHHALDQICDCWRKLLSPSISREVCCH